jgi:hypothetical protein
VNKNRKSGKLQKETSYQPEIMKKNTAILSAAANNYAALKCSTAKLQNKRK